jgi:crotonobetainyl-CoA:carnitine CoA-transferase CaiB-like acyl-CoA transferase
VIDFGRFIAGPYAAMMLADFGADVIRVERREGGEDRLVGPVADSGEGGLFLNLNRNKRGVTLDLGHARSHEIVRRLVRTADVVIANLPYDVLEKLRLDYASLRQEKSDVILVMASAFGADGPYRDLVGFDGVVQATSGAMSLTGLPEAPLRSIVAWADYGTALHAAFGAMAALAHRAKSGQGQLVDVSLLATGVMFMAPLLIEQAVRDARRQGQGNTGFYTAPNDAYRTRDGWVLVQTVGHAMFCRWARLVGRPDLVSDERCKDDITPGQQLRFDQ